MKALRIVWLGLLAVAILGGLGVWRGPLFAPASETARATWIDLPCGSLYDIDHYTKHPTFDGDNVAPWEGAGDTGELYVDIEYRQYCLTNAGTARAYLAASGIAGLVLLGVGVPIVVSWTRQRHLAKGKTLTRVA